VDRPVFPQRRARGFTLLEVALIVAIPALGHGIFLLDVTPGRLLTAAIIGGVGAALVELSYRTIGHIAQESADI